jgi:hypothetical protein
MAMRAQFFEGTVATPLAGTISIPAGTRINIMGRIPADAPPAYSGIFTDYRGGMGRIQFTKATEFIVIEHISSSPVTIAFDTATVVNNPGAVQLKINTTEYFLNPDGSQNNGISGFAAPYPRTTAFQDSFALDPDVYVLPGQNWEIEYVVPALVTGIATARNLMRVACKFTLYDGTDAVIANKLLEMGISVKPANIDWYKRKLIEARTV